MAKILNISGTEIKDSGIQKLADYVEANLKDEFTLVIGCKPSIYDVDAVLIGGGNIFAIECKDWKGTISGGSYGWWQKDGQVIENPLQQTRNNAAALGKWLREKVKNIEGSVWVKGILLFTHEEGEIIIDIDETSNTGIEILGLDELEDYLSEIKEIKNNEIGKYITGYFYYYVKEKNMKNTNIGKYLKLTSVAILIITIGAGISFNKGNEDAFIILFASLLATIILSLAAAFLGGASEGNEVVDEKFITDYDYDYDLVIDPLNIYGTHDRK